MSPFGVHKAHNIAPRCFDHRPRDLAKRNKAIYQDRRNRAIARRAPWFDEALVEDIYKLARIYRAAGVACEVDHIVPLMGENVRGLHVQDNLTVLLKTANRVKGNRLVN